MRKHLLPVIFCLLVSISANAQWTTQATAFATASRGINQIAICNRNEAWASAYDGVTPTKNVRDYTHTADGGNSWVAGTVPVPTNYNWSCIAAISADTAWAMLYKSSGAGASGLIYRTDDGGGTWNQQGTGSIYLSGSSFPDVIYFWDKNTGVSIGDPLGGEFEIYTTSDGGTTWTGVDGANIPDPLDASEYGTVRDFGVHKNVIWFGTTEGRVFMSVDYGLTWTVSATGYPGPVSYVQLANENEGWAQVIDPTTFAFVAFLRTTDGGTSWTTVTPSGTYFTGSLAFVPNTAETLVSVGAGPGDIGSSYSLDGGDSWTTIDSAIQQYTSVSFFDNFTGWAGGFNVDAATGGIYQYGGSFVATGIPSITSKQFTLKTYPNPGNGLFYVSFDADNYAPINIQITDAVGNVVFKNSYKDKSQLWLRTIDLRNFSKGMYIMNVENNGNRAIQKLIVQ